MNVNGKVIVVTGGGSGIGRSLCHAFARQGARSVVVADINAAAAETVAAETGGVSASCDVSREAEVADLIATVEAQCGAIDLFCSNAGLALGFAQERQDVIQAADEVWAAAWQVNVMAHVYAARHLIPRMRERGGGYFLNTVSAAGLLTQIGSSVYATTKHAAVGFAETLAITHRDDGIRVSVLCPQGVETPMLRGLPRGPQSADGVLSADDVAARTIEGLLAETFLILPHAEVRQYMHNKIENYDRWVGGMAKLQRSFRS